MGLRALEYIVGAVLLGLVLVVTTSSKPQCPLDNPWSFAYNSPKWSGFIIPGMESPIRRNAVGMGTGRAPEGRRALGLWLRTGGRGRWSGGPTGGYGCTRLPSMYP